MADSVQLSAGAPVVTNQPLKHKHIVETDFHATGVYFGLRKQTPEPVFGIIKSVMGYRQSLLRGQRRMEGRTNLGR